MPQVTQQHPYYEKAANRTAIIMARKHLPPAMQVVLMNAIGEALLEAYDAGVQRGREAEHHINAILGSTTP